MPSDKNIVLIWDRIGHYHNARWEALEKQLSDTSVFCADFGQKDKIYKWQGEWTKKDNYLLLSDKTVETTDIRGRIRNYLKIIRTKNIKTVCIPGYGRLEYIIMIVLSKILKIKIILFAESWYKRSKTTDRIKGLFLRTFCDAFFVSGKRAKKHFVENLKIQPKKIQTGYSVVDNEHFKKTVSLPKREKNILCVARFSEEKNLSLLIEAFKKSDICADYKLQLIGGGHLKNDLIQKAKPNKNIEIIEWVSYKQLPEFYHKASFFVLPSVFEPWGLVVNEAMAAGLPVILSEQCGCRPDLINSENGFIFDANNSAQLIEIFNSLQELSDENYLKMGKNATECVNDFTVQMWANQIIKMSKD